MTISNISSTYRQLQEELHERYNYGVTGRRYTPEVNEFINRHHVSSLLDYGCGKSQSLTEGLEVKRYAGYDPAVPKFSDMPSPADLVCCIDVLEHVEPEYLDNVLDHIKALALGYVFLTVATGPAAKVMADGRNAHLIQKPMEWWLPRLTARWDTLEAGPAPGGFKFTGETRRAETL